jgi:2-amino-4-hydroxy-6-hydroxymethyldihydropteridine diphosphokinase
VSVPATACIGLGANLGEPIQALRAAILALDAMPDSRVIAASSLYRTPAWGRTQQPDFINAAVRLQTYLPPLILLAQLLEIERQAGRDRSDAQVQRWGPRVLDLDVLLYGEQVIDVPGLQVPHPQLHARAFALVPLAEVAAGLPFPGHGTVADALRQVDVAGVVAVV